MSVRIKVRWPTCPLGQRGPTGDFSLADRPPINTRTTECTSMKTKPRSLLISVLAMTAFIMSSAAAMANSFSITPGGNITAASQGLVTLATSVLTTFCRMTLSGSLARGLIAKQRLNQFGSITSGGTTCNPVSGTPITMTYVNLPWRIRYETILGSLPTAVTGILFHLNPVALSFNINGMPCTMTFNLQGILSVLTRVSGLSYATNLLRLLTRAPDTTSGSGFCPTAPLTVGLAGDFSLTPRQTLVRLP